ncbi:hypothetical protein Tco_0473990 [Tanacetum coccineum]
MRRFCEKHYVHILSFIAKKAHNEKLKDVRSRLTYREDTEQETKSASRHRKRMMRGGKQKETQKSPSLTRSRRAKRQEQRRKDARELIRSYVTCSSERQRENEREYRRCERAKSSDGLLESEDNAGGRHWKRRSRKARKDEGDDLSEPYDEESTTLFTRRINKFVFLKWIRMSSSVKTYDGTCDPEDHLKTFTTTAKVERWVMPTWCHMFNATLLGSAWLWFDELPLESIDNFKDLRRKFLAHYLQQKRFPKRYLPWKSGKEPSPPLPQCREHRSQETKINTMIFIEINVITPMTACTERDFEKAVKSGQLAHLVKEIKQGSNKASTNKPAKKSKATPKGQRSCHLHGLVLGKKCSSTVGHAHTTTNEYSFSPLNNMDIEDHPIVICAEIGGHNIHRIYVDGGSALRFYG